MWLPSKAPLWDDDPRSSANEHRRQANPDVQLENRPRRLDDDEDQDDEFDDDEGQDDDEVPQWRPTLGFGSPFGRLSAFPGYRPTLPAPRPPAPAPRRAAPSPVRPAPAVVPVPAAATGGDQFAAAGLRVSPDPGWAGQCQFHGRHSRCSNRAALVLMLNGATAAACEGCALIIDRGATNRGYAFRAQLSIVPIGGPR